MPISIECVTYDVVVVESTYSRLTAQPWRPLYESADPCDGAGAQPQGRQEEDLL